MAMQNIKLGGFINEEVTKINSNFDEIETDYAKSADIPAVPTKTSDLQNDSGFITSADIPAVPTKTSDLQNDSGFLTQNSTAFTNKVDKEAGKGLSENNYTTAEKTKLEELTAAYQINFAVADFGQAQADGYVYVTKAISSGTPIATYRLNGSNYEKVAAGVEVSGGNVIVSASEAFAGYIKCI